MIFLYIKRALNSTEPMTLQFGKTAGPNYEITNLNPSTNPKNSSNPSIDFPQNNRAKRDLTPTARTTKIRYDFSCVSHSPSWYGHPHR